MFEKFFENRKAKRDEEYQRTLEAYGSLHKAEGELEKSVDEFGNVNIRIEKNKINTKIEFEESKLKLATIRRDQQGISEAEGNIQEYKRRLEELDQQLTQRRDDQRQSRQEKGFDE